MMSDTFWHQGWQGTLWSCHCVATAEGDNGFEARGVAPRRIDIGHAASERGFIGLCPGDGVGDAGVAYRGVSGRGAGPAAASATREQLARPSPPAATMASGSGVATARASAQ